METQASLIPIGTSAAVVTGGKASGCEEKETGVGVGVGVGVEVGVAVGVGVGVGVGAVTVTEPVIIEP